MSPVKEYSSNDDLIDEKYKCRPKLFVSQDLKFSTPVRDAQQSPPMVNTYFRCMCMYRKLTMAA